MQNAQSSSSDEERNNGTDDLRPCPVLVVKQLDPVTRGRDRIKTDMPIRCIVT